MPVTKIGLRLVVLYAAINLGCTKPTAVIPVPQIEYSTPEAASDRLIVLLPGIYDRAVSFERNGFIEAARARGVNADFVAVDAQYSYYAEQIITERLHQDVMVPAKLHGYRDIWLVGISLGGYGALLYERSHPGVATAILLLAPYLGPPELIASVRSGDEVFKWHEMVAASEPTAAELWAWITAAPKGMTYLHKLHLGYGADDRYVAGHELLASLLPRARVFSIVGGHDWQTWRALWDEAIARGTFDNPRRSD